MQNEAIFAAAQAAELTRVKTCCEGVENKLCSTDEWKGNLGPFAAQIERRTMERAIAFVERGSFLHDDAPAARMARECAKEMRKQLLSSDYVFVTPTTLQSAAKDLLSPIGSSLSSPSNPARMTEEYRPDFVATPTLPLEAPVVAKPEVAIAWSTAIMLFRTHLTQKFLRAGMHVLDIEKMLKEAEKTYSAEADEKLQQLLAEANVLAGRWPPDIKERPDHPMDPILGEEKPAALHVHTTDTSGDFTYEAKIAVVAEKKSKIGEDGVLKND